MGASDQGGHRGGAGPDGIVGEEHVCVRTALIEWAVRFVIGHLIPSSQSGMAVLRAWHSSFLSGIFDATA